MLETLSPCIKASGCCCTITGCSMNVAIWCSRRSFVVTRAIPGGNNGWEATHLFQNWNVFHLHLPSSVGKFTRYVRRIFTMQVPCHTSCYWHETGYEGRNIPCHDKKRQNGAISLMPPASPATLKL